MQRLAEHLSQIDSGARADMRSVPFQKALGSGPTLLVFLRHLG